MIKVHAKKEMHTAQGNELLDINLNIPMGEFVTLFGESGAGKTTLLRIIAGLTKPKEGRIEIDGETWFDSVKNINLPIQYRKIGFVFQDSNLFPHMTILENLEYACADKDEQKEIDQWLSIMNLKGLKNQKPDKISVGQKQRVALIRALLNKPKILLLDEPLSGLDVSSRLNLQDEIIKVYQKTKITTILVSHDLSEVFKLSKMVYVLERGKIIQSGSPEAVFINHDLGEKFKFTGEIIKIEKEDLIYILTIRIGNQITKVKVDSQGF